MGATLPAQAGPHYGGAFVTEARLDKLQKRVRAPGAPIDAGCRRTPGSADDGCASSGLDRVRARLAGAGDGVVRVLHLGDSHVAADFITSRIRRDLQAKFGNGGRGFVHPDQRWGYGGRRIYKSKDWIRDRIVDGGRRIGRPYGFSGNSLKARRAGARVSYRIRPGDRAVRIYYRPRPKAQISVSLDGRSLGRFKLSGPAPFVEVVLPERKAKRQRRGPPGNTLRIRARTAGVMLFGLSFEGDGAGLQYSVIGPVGADAKVYLQMENKSFVRHLRAYQPDLVTYMVGGNDALKIRKRWTSLAKVERDHRQLFERVRQAVPDADCLVWAPMVAGRRKGDRIVSKAYLSEVRDMQRRVAREAGCAFWDTLTAMGGPKNVSRWAPIMAKDLVHPRKSAADLMGRMFVQAWLEKK